MQARKMRTPRGGALTLSPACPQPQRQHQSHTAIDQEVRERHHPEKMPAPQKEAVANQLHTQNQERQLGQSSDQPEPNGDQKHPGRGK